MIKEDIVSKHRKNSIVSQIEFVFKTRANDLNRVIYISNLIKGQIELIDPYLQKMSSSVCSVCTKCCCIDRYSYYSCDDLIYIISLGLKPQELQSDDDSGPCYFLYENGCRLDRTVRPSGCNWYFCDSLYREIQAGSDDEYIFFSNNMEIIFNLWIELAEEFRSRFKDLTGSDLEEFDLADDSYRKAFIQPY